MLVTSSSTLMPSGRKLLSPQQAASLLWKGQKITLPVLPSKDTQLYKQLTGVDLTQGIDIAAEEVPPTPKYNVTDEQLNAMLLYIVDNPRDDTDTATHFSRIEKEWTFFESQNVLPFIYNAWELIKKFEQDKVIWGVGRGSSVASYILFLLKIHDINPIKYGIEFKEFSKEL